MHEVEHPGEHLDVQADLLGRDHVLVDDDAVAAEDLRPGADQRC